MSKPEPARYRTTIWKSYTAALKRRESLLVWLARKHDTHRRQYPKVHLAMAPGTGDIRAVNFTSSREGDSPILPDLLAQISEEEEIGTTTGDGIFDTRRWHSASRSLQGTRTARPPKSTSASLS
jgi:hypothetical protein